MLTMRFSRDHIHKVIKDVANECQSDCELWSYGSGPRGIMKLATFARSDCDFHWTAGGKAEFEQLLLSSFWEYEFRLTDVDQFVLMKLWFNDFRTDKR